MNNSELRESGLLNTQRLIQLVYGFIIKLEK